MPPLVVRVVLPGQVEHIAAHVATPKSLGHHRQAERRDPRGQLETLSSLARGVGAPKGRQELLALARSRGAVRQRRPRWKSTTKNPKRLTYSTTNFTCCPPPHPPHPHPHTQNKDLVFLKTDTEGRIVTMNRNVHLLVERVLPELEAVHETLYAAPTAPFNPDTVSHSHTPTKDVTIRYFLHAPNDVVMATTPLTLQFADVVEFIGSLRALAKSRTLGKLNANRLRAVQGIATTLSMIRVLCQPCAWQLRNRQTPCPSSSRNHTAACRPRCPYGAATPAPPPERRAARARLARV